MKVILASQSPRRKYLLSQIIKNFEIIPSNFDEDKIKQEEKKPNELVMILSKGKGEEVFDRVNLQENFIIISSDTMVYCDKELMGKPKDNEDAFRMLKKLQDNMHTVYTGVYVIAKINGKIEKVLDYSKTDVYFKKLTDEEILKYIEENKNIFGQARSLCNSRSGRRIC